MGIYGALSTAVTGLNAQSFALENISGNIANSQTIGFKRVDTTFLDMIPDQPTKIQTSGSVIAQSQATNTTQGDVKSVTNSTYMAVNGSGFFVVQPSPLVSIFLVVFSVPSRPPRSLTVMVAAGRSFSITTGSSRCSITVV